VPNCLSRRSAVKALAEMTCDLNDGSPPFGWDSVVISAKLTSVNFPAAFRSVLQTEWITRFEPSSAQGRLGIRGNQTLFPSFLAVFCAFRPIDESCIALMSVMTRMTYQIHLTMNWPSSDSQLSATSDPELVQCAERPSRGSADSREAQRQVGPLKNWQFRPTPPKP